MCTLICFQPFAWISVRVRGSPVMLGTKRLVGAALRGVSEEYITYRQWSTQASGSTLASNPRYTSLENPNMGTSGSRNGLMLLSHVRSVLFFDFCRYVQNSNVKCEHNQLLPCNPLLQKKKGKTFSLRQCKFEVCVIVSMLWLQLHWFIWHRSKRIKEHRCYMSSSWRA